MSETYKLSQVLMYSGENMIGRSEDEIPIGTIIKIPRKRGEPKDYRGRKWRVIACEEVSDGTSDFQVNLKSK